MRGLLRWEEPGAMAGLFEEDDEGVDVRR